MSILHESLNQAIYNVCVNPRKSDAKEAHKLVESYGYETFKLNGYWHVKNPKTGRELYISTYDYGNNFISILVHVIGIRAYKATNFDFVGYLNCNREYRGFCAIKNTTKSEARRKYNLLRQAKINVKYGEDDVYFKKVQVDRAMESLKESEQILDVFKGEVEKLRKEFGLTK